MKLEQQVTSLEPSQKLKELGVKQESLFAWTAMSHMPNTEWRLWTSTAVEEWVSDGRIAAFTVAELGEMLPFSVHNTNGVFCGLDITKGNDEQREGFQWMVSYLAAGQYAQIDSQVGSTEADARAKMLIYLLENNLLTLNTKTV